MTNYLILAIDENHSKAAFPQFYAKRIAVMKEYSLSVHHATSMQEGLTYVAKHDVAITIIMHDDADCLPLFPLLRQIKPIPILVVGKYELEYRITAYDYGVDNVIEVPESDREFFTIVRAMIRRHRELNLVPPDAVLTASHNKTILFIKHLKAVISNRDICFTWREFELLRLFLSNRGKMFSYEQLSAHLWNNEPYFTNNMLWSLVSRVKSKLKGDSETRHGIQSVYGKGYVFRPE